MSYELVITATDGTERARLSILDPDSIGAVGTPSLTALSIRRQITRSPDGTDTAEATVYRDSWTAIESQIDRLTDRFVVEETGTPIFGGRLRDTQTDSATVSVLLDGFKRDAIDAKPSGGNDVYPPQADSQIITDELLPRVGTLSAGTIETVDPTAAVSESNASPGKTLTRLAVSTGAEVRYNPDRTIEYVDRLGSDRTDTLAGSMSTLLGDPTVQEDVTEQVTHVRVLGSGSGTRQISVEKVAPSYESGRRVYRKYVDKDIQQQARAENIAEQLIAEYDGSRQYVEVTCVVPATVLPSLGDSFEVVLPNAGLSKRLRVLELERTVDSSGERFALVLSNRKLTRELNAERRERSLEQFRSGNAGQYYALADGEGWDVCNQYNPLQFTVYRPKNTIAELRAVLHIQTRQPRIRVEDITATQSNDDFTRRTASAGGITATQLSADVWNTVDTHTGQSPCSELRIFVQTIGTDFDCGGLAIRVRNTETGYKQRRALNPSPVRGDHQNLTLFIPNNINGDEIKLEVKPNEKVRTGGFVAFLDYTEIGTHTHEIELESGVAEGSGALNTLRAYVNDTEITDPNFDPLDPVDISRDITNELKDGPNTVTVIPNLLGSGALDVRAEVELEGIKNATEPQQ